MVIRRVFVSRDGVYKGSLLAVQVQYKISLYLVDTIGIVFSPNRHHELPPNFHPFRARKWPHARGAAGEW